MLRLISFLVLIVVAAWPVSVRAQSPIRLCYGLDSNPGSCITVTDGQPLPVTGGGGGGGAVTIANGADAVLGSLTDAASCASGTTAIACLRQIDADIKGSIPAGSATIGNTVNAPTSSSSLALSKVSCGSAVSSCVLKASAGNFYGVYAECTSACWLMVFNSATAPSNGATTAGVASGNLVECIDIGAGSHGGVNYLPIPVAYSVGITAVISSTACASLTLSTVGFVSGSVM